MRRAIAGTKRAAYRLVSHLSGVVMSGVVCVDWMCDQGVSFEAYQLQWGIPCQQATLQAWLHLALQQGCGTAASTQQATCSPLVKPSRLGTVLEQCLKLAGSAFCVERCIYVDPHALQA